MDSRPSHASHRRQVKLGPERKVKAPPPITVDAAVLAHDTKTRRSHARKTVSLSVPIASELHQRRRCAPRPPFSTYLVEDKRHDAGSEDGVTHVDVVVGPETLEPVERLEVDVRVEHLLGGRRVGDDELLRDRGGVLAQEAHGGVVGGLHREQVTRGSKSSARARWTAR